MQFCYTCNLTLIETANHVTIRNCGIARDMSDEPVFLRGHGRTTKGCDYPVDELPQVDLHNDSIEIAIIDIVLAKRPATEDGQPIGAWTAVAPQRLKAVRSEPNGPLVWKELGPFAETDKAPPPGDEMIQAFLKFCGEWDGSVRKPSGISQPRP